MNSPFLPHIRVRFFTSPETACPFHVISAAIVIANMPGTGSKNSIPDLTGIIDRYESHKFFKLPGYRSEYTGSNQSQLVANLVVNAFCNGVEIGVNSKYAYIMLYGFY